MLRSFSNAISMLALLAAASAPPAHAGSPSGELCALPTASLEAAVSQYTDSAFAIQEIKNHAVATWYTDRMSVDASQAIIKDITTHCDKDSRMTLVVYGLPNKDCDAGYSSGGFNKNTDDYKKWLQTLADGVGQRKVLYVLEPDAVGLLAKGGCGVSSGYEANVKLALEILTKNPNADIYLDVGYWTLSSASDASGVASIVKSLAQAGRLKGISLNTSNYRPTKQISDLCGNFQKAYGDNSLHCVVDTSRNYNDSPPSSEWCNAKFGGVGRPPTSSTGFENLDYFIWIKPAGESDGSCDGGDHTADAMKGPAAGSFFKDHFVQLWNNGYYVKEKNFPVIDGSARPTSAPTPFPSSPNQNSPATDAPVSQIPTATTPAPTTPTPAPTTLTPTVPGANTSAPVSQSPLTQAPTPTPSPSPVSQSPTSTTPAPQKNDAVQYKAVPTPESRSITDPASTPAPTPKSKKNKKKKRCPSDLADIPEPDANAPIGAVKAVGTEPNFNLSSKSVSFASLNHEERVAPEIPVNADVPTDNTTTRTNDAASTGIGGGVVAAMVVAGVMVVAVAAVALRQRSERRRQPDLARPSVTTFGAVGVTPAGITVL